MNRQLRCALVSAALVSLAASSATALARGDADGKPKPRPVEPDGGKELVVTITNATPNKVVGCFIHVRDPVVAEFDKQEKARIKARGGSAWQSYRDPARCAGRFSADVNQSVVVRIPKADPAWSPYASAGDYTGTKKFPLSDADLRSAGQGQIRYSGRGKICPSLNYRMLLRHETRAQPGTNVRQNVYPWDWECQ